MNGYRPLRVGLSRKLLDARGQPPSVRRRWPWLEADAAMAREFAAEAVDEITPDITAGYDGLAPAGWGKV